MSSKLPKFFYDIPNHRSSHIQPTLKIGGLIFYITFLLSNLFFINYDINFFIFCTFCIFLISLLDDIFECSNLLRLFVHFLICTIVILDFNFQNFYISLFYLISLVWITNLYNFVDGIDGLAGSMTLIGFSALGAAAFMSNDVVNLCICLTLIFTTIPFLYFNFFKSVIFLGDSGAVTLGFMAGFIGLSGWVNESWPIWFPTLVFSTIGADATLTVIIKIFSKTNPLIPHKEYFFHKLVDLGIPKKFVTYIYFSFMFLSASLAIFLLSSSINTIYIIFYSFLLFLFIILMSIHYLWLKKIK